ncbi:hypothetical protein SprV_0301219200 [Sparganum proliferum]
MWNFKQPVAAPIDCVPAPTRLAAATAPSRLPPPMPVTAVADMPEEPLSPVKPPAKMVNRLKSLVSKKKKRFQADGFDLDLSYISPRIIAMGFPAERIEGLYRNHIEEVSRFFEQKHKGHYKIYHLCSERDFDACRFSGPVVRYPFSDHSAPQFDQIMALCEDAMQFLNLHPENIVAINCKAGKGRTGVMVCACLMEMQEAKDAADALRIYAERRTRNGQGVTIPSQRRYVDYYSRLINGGLSYEPTPLRLVAIRVEGLQHHLHGIQSFDLRLSMYKQRVANCACEGGPRLELKRQIEMSDKLCASSASEVNGPCICRSDIFPFEKASSSLSPCSPNDRLSPFYEHSLHTHPSRHRSESSHTSYSKTQTITTDTGLPHPTTDSSVCHNCGKPVYSAPSKVSFSVACSTHHEDNGDYLIHLEEPVPVAGDVRIKIKAKVGVLPKVIGKCWLNTFFIADSCRAASATTTVSEDVVEQHNRTSCCRRPQQLRPQQQQHDHATLDPTAHVRPTSSDSSTGHQSSSSCSSTATSGGEDVRLTPPLPTEGCAPTNASDGGCAGHLSPLTAVAPAALSSATSCPIVCSPHHVLRDCRTDLKEPCSSCSSLSSVSSDNSPHFDDWPHSNRDPSGLRWTSNPFKFGSSGSRKKELRQTLGATAHPQNAILLSSADVCSLRLSQSELDDAFKGKMKKLGGEEYKVVFEFLRDVPGSVDLFSLSSPTLFSRSPNYCDNAARERPGHVLDVNDQVGEASSDECGADVESHSPHDDVPHHTPPSTSTLPLITTTAGNIQPSPFPHPVIMSPVAGYDPLGGDALPRQRPSESAG